METIPLATTTTITTNTKKIVTVMCPDEKGEAKPIQLFQQDTNISELLKTIVCDCCTTEEEKEKPISLNIPYEIFQHILWYFKECQGNPFILPEMKFNLDEIEKADVQFLQEHTNTNINQIVTKTEKMVYQWLDQLYQDCTRLEFVFLFFRIRKMIKFLLIPRLQSHMDYWFYTHFLTHQTIGNLEQDIQVYCRMKQESFHPFHFSVKREHPSAESSEE